MRRQRVSQAHKLSDSYLTLRLADSGATFSGQWDIALRDLDYAIGIDSNHDGEITWGELKAAEQRITSYAFGRLTLESIARGDRDSCALRPAQMLVDEHVDGHYAVLRFTAECRARPVQLAVHYSLLFDVDPTHRGLLQIAAGPLSQAAVLPREAPSVAIDLDSPQRWRQFTEFVTEGVWHIWKGFRSHPVPADFAFPRGHRLSRRALGGSGILEGIRRRYPEGSYGIHRGTFTDVVAGCARSNSRAEPVGRIHHRGHRVAGRTE